MINKALNHLEELLITFLIGAATVIIFISVVHRYMSGVDIPGLQDWLLTPMACAPASTSVSTC